MKYFFLTFLLFFSSVNADLTIAYDTQSFGDPKEISATQKPEVDKILKIAKDKNIKVIFKPVPWKRALLMVEKGLLDGVIQASYKTDRAKFANYPMKDNQPDTTKKLNDGNSYYIYKHKDSPLKWDGKNFLTGGTVAAMEQYAVIDDLKKHSNIKIITFTYNTDIVRKLAQGKFDAYAASARITDNLLKKFPALAQNIIKESLPIRKKPYYLIFSKKTYKKKSQEMELIWSGLKEFNKN